MKFPGHITTAYLPVKHYFEFNSSDNAFGGFDGNFFKTLSETLNFNYTLVSPPDSEWGRKKTSGTWSGVIGMIVRGEADIGVAFLAPTKERQEVVDFSGTYQDTHRTFFTDFPAERSRAFVNLYPFRTDVWIGFVTMLAVLSLVFYLTSFRKRHYLMWLLELFANVSGQSYFRRPRATLLTATWWIVALVISMCYSSVLLSMFFVPLRDPPIRTLEELSKAVDEKGYKVFSLKGSSALYELRKAKKDGLAEKIEKNNWFYDSDQLGLKLEDKAAYLSTGLVSNLLYGIPPQSLKFISEDTFEPSPAAVAIRKDFCCKERLNLAIKRMIQSGLTAKFLKDEIFRRRLSVVKEMEEKTHGPVPLSLGHIFGAFVVLVIGHAFSALLLLAEKAAFVRMKF